MKRIEEHERSCESILATFDAAGVPYRRFDNARSELETFRDIGVFLEEVHAQDPPFTGVAFTFTALPFTFTALRTRASLRRAVLATARLCECVGWRRASASAAAHGRLHQALRARLPLGIMRTSPVTLARRPR